MRRLGHSAQSLADLAAIAAAWAGCSLSSASVDVAIAGGHGKVARRLARLLAERGDRPRALIRDPAQAEDVGADGSDPVVCDLEHAEVGDLAAAIAGADAVVFAAGAGAGSGAARKLSMDRDGAIKLLDAARAAEVPGYVMLSSAGAEDPPDGDDVFSVYLRAKAEADRAVAASDRRWTIVRPGRLTDHPGTGRVRIQREPFRGEIPREDVAAVLDAVLRERTAAGHILYVNAGEDSVERALASALAG